MSTTVPWLFFLFDAFVAYLAIRRTTTISPLSIFCIFNAVCLMYFIILVGESIVPSLYRSAMPFYGLKPYVLQTSAYFALLNALAIPFIYSVPKITKNNFVDLQNRLKFLLSDQAIIGTLAVVGLMSFVHMLDFDLAYMWRYRGYLTMGDDAIVGVTNPIASFYQKFGPMMAGICIGVASLCYYTDRRRLVPIALLVGAYGFLFTLAGASRELAIFFLLPAAIRYFFRKKVDVLVVLLGLLTAGSILYATSARSMPELGLAHVFDALATIKFTDTSDSVLSLLSNVAQGGLVYANTIRIDPTFPFIYKYMSLISPLPGGLDGYYQAREAYQINISRPNPMGAFSEAWEFGWIWFLGLYTVSLLLLRGVTMQMFQRASVLTLPLFGFGLLLIYRLHHYPARISQRFILLMIILFIADYALTRWQAKQRLARERRREILRRRAQLAAVSQVSSNA